ncbi:unnamed protein product [Arctia plantaginis]|uniref:Prolyl 4-hydroxylase alpha-subunit N-terminal domain-containing protein n=1 Tax=Arctia plantaginis TaxID=874455 RepID=A0A8S0YUC4_ARCPL|nr:unnamed protein product [Arctia plantaginis]CAB3247914.1 unnamed protein product [Arctia plantaginis]
MLFSTCLAFLIYLGLKVGSDKYSLTSKVEHLLETHQALTEDLESYVKVEENRLSLLKRYSDIFEREHEKAIKDIPKYVGNPINEYTLIRRLTLDMHYIKLYIRDYAQNINRHHKNLKYPSVKDLIDAAKALNNLRNIYNEDIKEIANGKLYGIVYSSPMTSWDCYELGRALYHAEDLTNSITWMFEALRKFKEEKPLVPRYITSIIEYIRVSFDKLGDLKGALQWIREILVLYPSNFRVKQIALDYQNRIGNKKTMWMHTATLNVSEGGTTDIPVLSLSGH